MEDLHRGNISLDPAFFSPSRLDELKKEFDVFKNKISAEVKDLERENKSLLSRYLFDKKTGRGYILKNKLSPSEQRLYEIVSERFSFANYFIEENNRVKNRNEIYYATFFDESRDTQVIKVCTFLDTVFAILLEIRREDFGNNNFIIASLFDDIRYKFILLYEDILANDISFDVAEVEELTSMAIMNYYTYLLGIPQYIISYSQMIDFVNKARKFIIEYVEKFDENLKPLRKYKEADIPVDNLLLIDKIKRNLPSEEIQCIIGLRFGGIELPFLIKHFIYPKAEIRQIKISMYSSEFTEASEQAILQSIEGDKVFFKTKNVLIVDDSITTARTVDTIISALKHKTKNIYFSCVYYSKKNRIPQMRMDGHGGVNLQELSKCCVLKETNYAAAKNRKTYLSRNNKFDLTKEAIKTRLEKNPIRIEFVPKEKVPKDKNTKKVFIACDKAMIPSNYSALLYIRNTFNSKKEYEIVDDWIDGSHKRIQLDGSKAEYKEETGRNFLNEAINDIRHSDLVVLYYPAQSVYLSLLFRIAETNNKSIWICYSHKEDIKGFEKYSNIELIQIQKLKATLSQI